MGFFITLGIYARKHFAHRDTYFCNAFFFCFYIIILFGFQEKTFIRPIRTYLACNHNGRVGQGRAWLGTLNNPSSNFDCIADTRAYKDGSILRCSRPCRRGHHMGGHRTRTNQQVHSTYSKKNKYYRHIHINIYTGKNSLTYDRSLIGLYVNIFL